MTEVRLLDEVVEWMEGLVDRKARVRIQARLDRMVVGNPGDVRSVGSGVFEMRIDYGPGYRVYFVRRGNALVIVLAGGDKRSQSKDIARAIKLSDEV